MNVKELLYSQQQPHAPKTHKKKPTIRQAIRTVFCAPQRSLLYRLLVLDEVKCKTHTQQSTRSTQKRLEAVNLIENAQRDTFKAPCCCFENVPNTALTIVCTINVSIDCKKNKVSNLNQEKNILDYISRQQVAWFVFCFKIKRLCAKMMISLLLRLMRT